MTTLNKRVNFHNMERSDAVAADVDQRIDKLTRYYDRIIGCDVTIEAPHHSQHKGHHYRIVIKVQVPGDLLVVSHDDGSNPAHEDCYIAVRDAFRNARRRLQDYSRLQQHDGKPHRNRATPE